MSERMCSKCALMPASVTHLCPPPDGRLAIWQDGYVHGETDGYEKGWERGAARALREAADDLTHGLPEGPAAIHFCPIRGCNDVWESSITCDHADVAEWLRARAEQVNP